MSTFLTNRRLVSVCLSVLMLAVAVQAQTTEFTYQGKLTDGGAPANGSYDLDLKLCDASTGGTVLGTQQKPSVSVNNGVFTVQLDFGLTVFAGPPRFLEIGVRPAGSPDPFTVLTPRQPVSSTPYAVRSLNASVADTLSSACVGCVTSSQIGSVDGATITGSVPAASLPGNSGSYVQNTVNQQASSNFNISGTGSADIFNANAQYNIGGTRALSFAIVAGVFAGRQAGAANTSGSGNSFFGDSAGRSNTTASNNSFFGRDAGVVNTASDNSFFGAFAGSSNTTATRNSYFGRTAGEKNQGSSDNSFFGYSAGRLTTGEENSFFGSSAGAANTFGIDNAFFGFNAGGVSTNGGRNAFFGARAGIANTTGGQNAFFGEDTGRVNTSGSGNTFIGRQAGFSNTTGSNNTYIGRGADGSSTLTYATAIGAEAIVNDSNTVVLGRPGDNVIVPGNMFVRNIPNGGSTSLCSNPAGKISKCSSSLRYKTAVHTFTGGLSLVRRLRPITFNWKDGGMLDVGFGAEEVARVEPLLTTRDEAGQIEGVKYAQISTVLVNAVNEQQSQIESLLKQVRLQQQQIVALKRLVCSRNSKVRICK